MTVNRPINISEYLIDISEYLSSRVNFEQYNPTSSIFRRTNWEFVMTITDHGSHNPGYSIFWYICDMLQALYGAIEWHQ